MKKFIFNLFIILFGLLSNCCIRNDYDEYEEINVINIEKTLITYNDGFHCREATIMLNSKQQYLLFPIKYEDEIISGTRIKFYCNKIYFYKNKSNKWIQIDWGK